MKDLSMSTATLPANDIRPQVAAQPAQQPQPQQPPPQAPAAAAPKPGTGNLFAVVVACIALLGVLLVLFAWRLPPFAAITQSTDNAYVRGQITVISPQVTGYVASVPVQDYQVVKKGDVLATIDDRIYRQRLDQAQAALHAAEAALANSPQQQASARGSLDQTAAGVESAEAQLAKAKVDHDRSKRLFDAGALAQAQLDAATVALQTASADLAQARAQRGIAATSVTTAIVGRGALEANVESARAAVRLAEIDLENTRILAPRDGQLGEISVRQGAQVATGAQLMALVPDRLWVVANMKETQMRSVAVGQPVTLKIDALGGQALRGHVERIAPATGSEFSVIRPDNATGNFTKVAQRIPVRIAIDADQPAAQRLSPGMSVVARIDTGA
jgi:multidrug resistance efflux pump